MISENDIHMGSKTLNEVLLRVYWNDCALICYICGVMPSSDPFTVTSMKSLVCVNLLLQFKSAFAIRKRKLRWYGHVDQLGEKKIH